MNITTIKFRTYNNKAIYHFEFASVEEMNASFMRFSEFIESPKYKGKYFERDNILEYYPDYHETVLGHNIPGDKYKEFLKVFKGKLSLLEKLVINEIRKRNHIKDFYIIATPKQKDTSYSSLDHEIAHALYYLYSDYKNTINSVLEKAGYNEDDLTSYFTSMYDIVEFKEYDKSVWKDEIHAFLVDLGFGDKGFFYGRSIKRFFIQLFKRRIRLHFKYQKLAKLIKQIYVNTKSDQLLRIEE
jgi:predicted NodU family carbamoyl transferase